MKLYPNVTAIFIIWAIAVLTIFIFGFSNFPHSGKFTNNFWENLSNWDGRHYISIAQFGYSEKFQYAFFPLYPLLIRALNNITQNYLVAALLISIVSSFLAINLLYRLISKDFGKTIAQKIIWALLIFPTSFYFVTAYSEGLFFLLVVATFFFNSRGKLFWASVAASLASATRPVGLAVVLALLIDIKTKGNKNKKNWYALLSPLGFVLYCWYLFTQTQDPFYFITAQTHWLRSVSIPGVGFWETIKSLAAGDFIIKNFNAFLDLCFAVFGTGLVIRSFRFLPLRYSVYGLFSILLPLFTPSLSSMPRFLLPIFPIFILVAMVKNQYILFTYQLICVMLLSAFAILFINGFWVS